MDPLLIEDPRPLAPSPPRPLIISSVTQPPPPDPRVKWTNLLLLALAEALGMSLWFSASAVTPQLTVVWGLTPGEQSWMTMAVQIGFVGGALVSAVLNLSDHYSARRLFGMSALVAAVANGGLILLDGQTGIAIALRFITGFALAGVYPPGMKLVATWCKEDRGLGIGILVGALTVGKATPHLINGLFGPDGMPDWKLVIGVTSGQAVVAALLSLVAIQTGPYLAKTAPFDFRFAARALSHRPTRLANFGYLGHMWELYAMWTWAPIFLIASYDAAGWSVSSARFAGFATIAIGGLGGVVAGALADRMGRTIITSASLVISGACCIFVGFAFGSPAIATVVCLVWGFAVVADSAQFSAAVSELTDPRYVGTALTIQTSLGFLLTLVTIGLLPTMLDLAGWRYAFLILVPGPVFGIVSMMKLRRDPEAEKMAGGRK